MLKTFKKYLPFLLAAGLFVLETVLSSDGIEWWKF